MASDPQEGCEMYKLKIDMFLREPIVMECRNEKDRDSVVGRIIGALENNHPVTLFPGNGLQRLVTINPAYIRAIEEVDE